jgi:hypothetical protein
MNAAAFYPEHDVADKTAEHLSSLGVNLVRPHHDNRISMDWDPADCFSLLTYDGNSRTPNLKAWDHYDYLNAKLREKGIYIALSVHGSRSYLPDDVSILHVSAADDEAWADAMDDLNRWPWQKSGDPRKMLPVIDERCFLLTAEFARNMLTHVNPYTGIAYGKDPQILSVELVNEHSTAYALICGNTFPDYWINKINAQLSDYAKAHGVAPFTFTQRDTPEKQKCFAGFCVSLDEAFDKRMQKVIRDAGCTAPVECSNVFRGDDTLRSWAKIDGLTEGHGYYDPLVTKHIEFMSNLPLNALPDKPFLVGEINMPDWSAKLVEDEKAVRSMLPFAAAVYGSFQDWQGIIWFAWRHGQFEMGPDGWGVNLASRQPSVGSIAGDAVLLDHMRTAGIIFKNRYASPSVEPQTIVADNTFYSANYGALCQGQTCYSVGWQFVHGFRKTFAPVIPPEQSNAVWGKGSPPNPIISDTKQIVLDSKRNQLSFAAPKAEGFSGFLDGKPAANRWVLDVPGDKGFATVIAVTLDGNDLVKARKILLSRTYTDTTGKESIDGGQVILHGLTGGSWIMKITRSASAAARPQVLATGADGSLKLPAIDWNECELDH